MQRWSDLVDLEELLYWETLSDLVFDGIGTWEVAWRANTLGGAAERPSRVAAAHVIERLLAEGLVVAVGEDGAAYSPESVAAVLSGAAWARRRRPTPMIQLQGTAGVKRRVAELPDAVVASMRTSWMAGLGDIPARRATATFVYAGADLPIIPTTATALCGPRFGLRIGT